ncbi:MAG: SRPBCC family protein [Actinomycetota bacterium]|nr:SRPBCC family protein [Actinomycetota bacterium]
MSRTASRSGLAGRVTALAGRVAKDRLGVLAGPARDVRVAERWITIGFPPEAVYQFLREDRRVDQLVPSADGISAVGEDRDEPAAGAQRAMAWEIVEDTPGTGISWRAEPAGGPPVDLTVWLEKAPADLGTQVRLRVRVGGEASAPSPLGTSAAFVAVRTLRNAKSLLETGERPTLEGNPAGAPGGGRDEQEVRT